MKGPTVYSAAFLASLASTAIASDFQSFALKAFPKPNTDNKPGFDVVASDHSFFYKLNKHNGQYNKDVCKYEQKDMTQQTQFSYDFDTSTNPDGYLALNVLIPDGQQTYIAPNGAFKYKNNTAVETGKYKNFNFTTRPDDASPHGVLEFPKSVNCDAVGCSQKDGSYKIYAKEPHKSVPLDYGQTCEDIDLISIKAEGEPVYEYNSDPLPPTYQPSTPAPTKPEPYKAPSRIMRRS